MHRFPTEELIRLLLARALYWPILLAFLVLALIRWRKHPRASLWATLGLSFLLIVSIGRAAFYTIMLWLAPVELTIPDNGFINLATVSAVVWTTLDAIGIVVILLGVFSNRARSSDPGQSDASIARVSAFQTTEHLRDRIEER